MGWCGVGGRAGVKGGETKGMEGEKDQVNSHILLAQITQR